ncbi:MAG: hypothetical protein WCD08_15620 [Steroidobacteraceae bacterium]
MITVVTSILVLTGVASEAATPNHSTRASQFARLPNWSGLWVSTAWNAGISGRPPGGEDELRAKLQLIRPPPYNAQWEAKYQTALQDKVGLAARAATFKVCTRSFPALMEAPWVFEIATLPEETLLVFENGQIRHVYTDGRPHPSGDDIWATPLGDSIGHWEGQMLMVDTVARSAAEPMAPRAWVALLSDGAHFTERLRQSDANTLEDQLLIDDPTVLASPWAVTLRFRRVTGMDRMIPVDCVENERTTVVDGKMVITNP